MPDMTERPDTYFARALADAEAGGRFEKQIATNVVGAGPVKLPGPNWSNDPTGPEPPLGVAVDCMEPMGTPAEIEASQENADER